MKPETKQKIRLYKTEWQRRHRRAAAGLDPDAPPSPATGERNARAKLTRREVNRARKMREGGATIRHLAEQFGVSYSTMHSALSGATWGKKQ